MSQNSGCGEGRLRHARFSYCGALGAENGCVRLPGQHSMRHSMPGMTGPRRRHARGADDTQSLDFRAAARAARHLAPSAKMSTVGTRLA